MPRWLKQMTDVCSWPGPATPSVIRHAGCSTEHSAFLQLVARAIPWGAAAPSFEPWTHSLLLNHHHNRQLPSLQPNRSCEDVLNFRGRGPEDPRLLPVELSNGARGLLIFVTEYWPAAMAAQGSVAGRALQSAALKSSLLPNSPYGRGKGLAFDRRMVTYSFTLAEDGIQGGKLGPGLVLHPSSKNPTNLSSIEKNWSPFRIGSHVYVHQWLNSPAGVAVVHRVNTTSGELLEHFHSPTGKRLCEAIGALQHSVISGGTPAVQLPPHLCRPGVEIHARQHGCLIAMGHTMTATCNDPSSARFRSFLTETAGPHILVGETSRSQQEARERCWAAGNWSRTYYHFAYIFDTVPPFRIRAATREFRLPVAAHAGVPLRAPLQQRRRRDRARIQFPTLVYFSMLRASSSLYHGEWLIGVLC